MKLEFEPKQDFSYTTYVLYILYIITYHISFFVGLERIIFQIYLIICLSNGDTSKSKCDEENFSNYARTIGLN